MSPSISSNKNKWKLPTNPSPEGFFCISVNVPDDPEWIGKFYGQIYMLSQQIYWDRDDAHTAKDVAAKWLDVYSDTLAGGCDVPCVCTIPPAFGIDLGFVLRIVRVGAGGFIEELIDGVWSEPEGVYETPEPAIRLEPDRLCLAAANAAYVMEQLYEEATDAYAEFNSAVAVVDALLEAIATLMGAFGQAQAASAISFAENIFSNFYNAFGLLTGDVWNAAFTEEFTCILYELAFVSADIVIFDFEALIERIHELRYDAGLDADRQILLAQLEYLLNLTSAGGLNVAGGTTAIDDYDCVCPWCYLFNFVSFGDGGWTNEGANTGVHLPGTGWIGQTFNASSNKYLAAVKTFTATTINRVVIGFDKYGGSGANNSVILRLFNGATMVVNQSFSNATGFDRVAEWTGSVVADKIVFYLNNGTSGANGTMESAQVEGPLGSTNPFGSNNC